MGNDSSVNAWEEKVTIPTYGIGKPDRNPMFFEKRVYQGSSGKVYPNPIIEKIYDEKHDKEYTGLYLENEYIKLLVLPQLGGRIQMAWDKIKKRHFVYYNQVIKPALVGLTGPWISGGIEFNWPQHHRPSTFEPIDYKIEDNADGSKTIWVNEVERMFHTKGMAGFTLHPGKAYIEISVKLYNRSALPQTFLWWANPAVRVNDDYQSVFPPDVNAVFDHGKRDVSTFPIATGTYYKVDYSPGADISRYKNIPVPTSYMAINSKYDFVGGYEHDSRAGLLHVASHHVSPGKKQWTWGNSDFGLAWDRNLTDEDGPYIELMTGVFTDNQPDFTWIMPNEEKHFTQYFLPYRELGLVKNAGKDILLALDCPPGKVVVKIQVTGRQNKLNIILKYGDKPLLDEVADIYPEQVYVKEIIADTPDPTRLILTVNAATGKELLRYDPASDQLNEIPEPAKAAAEPGSIENAEQLFLTGWHIEQYRHATCSPVPYYEEALRRDDGDIRNNNALGLWYLRRGQFGKSVPYFQKAIATSTQRNANPYDTECYYNLGLALKFSGKNEDAYNAFYKATWGNAWQDSGYFSLAQIDMMNGDYALALEHTLAAIDRNAGSNKAYVLRSAAFRRMQRPEDAILVSSAAIKRDRFNLGALFELACCHKALNDDKKSILYMNELLQLSRGYDQNLIAYALDYANAGLYKEASGLLEHAGSGDCTNPMVYYYLGFFRVKQGEENDGMKYFKKAAAADPYLCFPNRLEDINILRLASKVNPADAKAPYYLGNLFYDKQQYHEAIELWEASALLDDTFPTVFRNLGMACFNKLGDKNKALALYEKAFSLDKTDPRVMMELDQLYKILNKPPEFRLKFIEDNLAVAVGRDDIYLDRITLYNFAGENEKAYRLIMQRKFHPWEGGEGKVSGQYVHALVEIAKRFIAENNFGQAIEKLIRAQTYPHNLGEGKLYGAQENDVLYWLGCACEGSGQPKEAREFFLRAANGLEEPSAAIFYNDQQPDKIYYRGLALKKLGELESAQRIFKKLLDYGLDHLNDAVKIDYFAVSLPDLLIFEDDLELRNKIHCHFLQGLGYLGLEQYEMAEKAFSAVLMLDAGHMGAKIHLDMVKRPTG